MMNLFRIIPLLVALALPSLAHAATCFWVGGTGSWSTSNTASWASSSGGTTGTCAATGGVPKQAADTATFDGSSGGGTVTVDSTMNGVTLTSIVAGAFTGTLDFSVNNPSMTITATFNASGSGARDIKLGSGTFTMTGVNNNVWDLTTSTNCTCASLGSATFVLAGTGSQNQLFVGGGKSYGTLSISARTAMSRVQITGANTFANLTMASPSWLALPASTTTTVTNAVTLAGSSATSILTIDNNGSTTAGTLSLAAGSTMTWMALRGVTISGAGAGLAATNSFDLQQNTSVTITGPSGGGGRIIGG